MPIRTATKETTMQHITATHDKTYYLTTDEIQVVNADGSRRSWGKCSLGIIPEGTEGRQVFQGPMVPGPWAFCTTHALVIHDGPRDPDPVYTIALGEPVTVDCLPGVWCFRPNNLQRLEGDGHTLVPFTGPLPTEQRERNLDGDFADRPTVHFDSPLCACPDCETAITPTESADLIGRMERHVRANPEAFDALTAVIEPSVAIAASAAEQLLALVNDALAEAEHTLAQNCAMNHDEGIAQWSREVLRLTALRAQLGDVG